MNALVQHETHAVAARQQFDLSPQTFEQALTFANYLADSDMVPKDFKGKPGNCLIAMQWGAELGLKPLQALQNLAIINGRPSLWGDAVIALVRGSAVCEYVLESDDGNVATCKVKRRGEPEQIRTFSMIDAKAAGLAGKQGPWTQYPKRMRQMRARAFALRDVFPDVLRGLPVAEEIMDAPLDRDQGHGTPLAPAGGASDALLQEAQAAAESGMQAYQKFWGETGPANRKALAGEHERLKAVASDADAARTVDAAPVITADKVEQMLRAARNVDALNEAAATIEALADEAEKTAMNTLYDELLAGLA